MGDATPRGHGIALAARRALARLGGAVVTDERAADVILLAVDEGALRGAVAQRLDAGTIDRLAGIGSGVVRSPASEITGGVWAVAWHHELERFSARELNARFRRRFGGPLGETSWAAWAALKLVGEAVVRGGAMDAAGLVAFFDTAPRFDAHKGEALTFRPWDQQLRQPLYLVTARRREEMTERRGPFAVVGDAGAPDLDALGTPAGESRCRLRT